ncbi:IS3 family transposase [Sporomusa acidovorans]|uniref:IS3 family transposase n=1 Tax=Sporomusa acidovorans TaxID=112900 RepID=UPI0011607DAA
MRLNRSSYYKWLAFWGTLKAEMYYLYRFFDYDSLKAAIDDYIDFYNNARFQERLKGLAPLEHRTMLLATA